MNPNITTKRDHIIKTALPDAVFDGWSWEGVLASAAKDKTPEDIVRALFPGKMADVLDGFADYADRQMLDSLSGIDPQTLKIRERIKMGVVKRFEFLNPHKEAVRSALSFWAMPPHSIQATRIVWRTADRIWDWAGDTATDYNRYTKRGLLSGILASTTLVWLNDTDSAMARTLDFLDRRIENVMTLGRIMGRLKPTKKAS